MPSSYIPGGIVPRPRLAAAAKDASTRDVPTNFVGPLVMPDTPTDEFAFEAPIYGADDLEAADDDTVGRGSDFKEVLISEGSYNVEIGEHGRKFKLTQLDIAKAQRARVNSPGVNPAAFDLELRGTNAATRRMMRHNELLIARLMTTEANYATTHVLDPLAAKTSALVREVIAEAAALVEEDAGAPANLVLIGVGARNSLTNNANFLTLLPEDAIKVLDIPTMTKLVSLAEGGQVMFPTSRVKDRATSVPYPLWNNHIWVGRVVPDLDGVNETFGRNWWKPDHRNGQRFYVNQVTLGVQENREIGVHTWYRPTITNRDFGVLIPTTDT